MWSCGDEITRIQVNSYLIAPVLGPPASSIFARQEETKFKKEFDNLRTLAVKLEDLSATSPTYKPVVEECEGLIEKTAHQQKSFTKWHPQVQEEQRLERAAKDGVTLPTSNVRLSL